MKNADKPAMPLGDPRIGEHAVSSFSMGLTKREYFAAMAMQGFLASISGMDEAGHDVSDEAIANLSVAQADALLTELEETR